MRLWRIRDRATFQRLRTDGVRRRSGPVTVSALPLDDGLPPRIAFAVGSHVGGAVVRNRLRRQLRAIVRQIAPPSGAYLLSVRPEGATCSGAELAGHVGRAFQAVGAPG